MIKNKVRENLSPISSGIIALLTFIMLFTILPPLSAAFFAFFI